MLLKIPVIMKKLRKNDLFYNLSNLLTCGIEILKMHEAERITIKYPVINLFEGWSVLNKTVKNL